jgi:HSP20 family protein
MIPSPFHGIFSSSLNADDDVPLMKKVQKVVPEQKAEAPANMRLPRTGTKGQVALDVFEFDNYYILKAPIAGVKLSDLDIEITDNVLTVRGHRRQTDEIPDNQYFVRECFWGEFERSVTLPCTIDPKKVKATFNKESILKILVPKEEKVKIIRIND